MNLTDQKKIRQEIKILSEEGRNKEEIFNLLKEKVNGRETVWLSGLVASILPEEIKLKYKAYNVVLSVLFTVSFLIWIYYPYRGSDSIKYLNYVVTLIFVLSIVNSLYKYDVSNLTGIIYVGFLIVAAIVLKGAGLMNPLYEMCALLPAAATFLTYRQRKTLFPEVNAFGRVKKDEKGNYIFSN